MVVRTAGFGLGHLNGPDLLGFWLALGGNCRGFYSGRQSRGREKNTPASYGEGIVKSMNGPSRAWSF